MRSWSESSRRNWKRSEVRCNPFIFFKNTLSHLCFHIAARVAGSSGEEHFDPKIPAEKQIVTYQTKEGVIKKVTKAELQEQMETREKLMNELNETWEQKLVRTQEVQKEREKALEELGITVEKNLVGVHTPKKVFRANMTILSQIRKS